MEYRFTEADVAILSALGISIERAPVDIVEEPHIEALLLIHELCNPED